MPDTLIENEAGKQTKAENITGLFPRPVPLPESNTNAPSTENPFITPPSSGGGFSDIGFTRFITPSWISVIWVICIVLNVISFLASFCFIGGMVKVTPNDDTGVIIFLLGTVVNVILHLLSLLFDRVFLELIIVVFRIEENTRGIRKNTRRIEEFTLAIAEQQ
ncbi:hypothetical protein FACS18942_01610 [Planctomycetales bacterium]|nr:hypothetical protein FACS18942_01610 [Planctomycetales bacterium]